MQTAIVLGMLFAVIVYRLAIVTALYGVKDRLAKENARLITSVTASIINLIVIIILSKVGQSPQLILLLLAFALSMAHWLSGRASDLRSLGRGFDSNWRISCIATLGKLFTTTSVPLSSSSINWYQSNDGDVLRLER